MQHKDTLAEALSQYSNKNICMAPLNLKTKAQENFLYAKTGAEWLEYWQNTSYKHLYMPVYIDQIFVSYKEAYYIVRFYDYAV